MNLGGGIQGGGGGSDGRGLRDVEQVLKKIRRKRVLCKQAREKEGIRKEI